MLALGEGGSRNPGSRSPYVLEALKGALEVRRHQPLQVADTLPLHSVVTLKPTLIAPARSQKKSFSSPRFFNNLHPIAPVASTSHATLSLSNDIHPGRGLVARR